MSATLNCNIGTNFGLDNQIIRKDVSQFEPYTDSARKVKTAQTPLVNQLLSASQSFSTQSIIESWKDSSGFELDCLIDDNRAGLRCSV